jgi:hypothetical protein
MGEEKETDKADYCTVVPRCQMFGRQHRPSHGSVAAAETVACGTAGWHRDVSVEEGGIQGGRMEEPLHDWSWISKRGKAHRRLANNW